MLGQLGPDHSKAMVLLLFIHCLLLLPLFVVIFIRSLFFYYAVLCVLSSFVIISVGKRELVDLHLLSSGCLLTDDILWLLLAVHAGIRDVFQGGGGFRPDGQKTVWTTFFFLNLFYSLQRGSNGSV